MALFTYNQFVLKCFKGTPLLLFCMLLGCGPDPPECTTNSVLQLDGDIFEGFINLCNAEGPSAIYEPGRLIVSTDSNKLYFQITSTNPSFNYQRMDSASYSCRILENKYRVFDLYNLMDNTELGSIDDSNDLIHFIINNVPCDSSSFFEGNRI